MNSNQRNMMVGLFVLAGMAGLGWMILRFGDLPTWVSKYDANTITIYFTEAPGIQESSSVLFRGYPVGRVVDVKPPALRNDLDNPQLQYYQVVVVAAISAEYQIPCNAVPKIYRRGLGSSFLEFSMEDRSASSVLLADGDEIKGVISEASEFISEGTQRKLDGLIASLTRLTDNLQGQLELLPPEVVDGADPNLVRPNVTTAVIRLDRSLKNLNQIVGDLENQHNIKTGLADFAALSSEMRDTVQQTQEFAVRAVELVEQASQTVSNLDNMAGDFNTTFQATGTKVQTAADALSKCLGRLDRVLAKVDAGDGTAGRVLNDPRLYESLTDMSENLSEALVEFRKMVIQWSQKGVKLK